MEKRNQLKIKFKKNSNITFNSYLQNALESFKFVFRNKYLILLSIINLTTLFSYTIIINLNPTLSSTTSQNQFPIYSLTKEIIKGNLTSQTTVLAITAIILFILNFFITPLINASIIKAGQHAKKKLNFIKSIRLGINQYKKSLAIHVTMFFPITLINILTVNNSFIAIIISIVLSILLFYQPIALRMALIEKRNFPSYFTETFNLFLNNILSLIKIFGFTVIYSFALSTVAIPILITFTILNQTLSTTIPTYILAVLLLSILSVTSQIFTNKIFMILVKENTESRE